MVIIHPNHPDTHAAADLREFSAVTARIAVRLDSMDAVELLGDDMHMHRSTNWSLPRTWTIDDELEMFDGLTRLQVNETLADWQQRELDKFQKEDGIDDDELRDQIRGGLVFWDEVRGIYRGHDFEECVIDSFYSDFEDVTGAHFDAALALVPGSAPRDLSLFNDDERCVSLAYLDSDPECLCGVNADGIIVKVLTLDGTVVEQ